MVHVLVPHVLAEHGLRSRYSKRDSTAEFLVVILSSCEDARYIAVNQLLSCESVEESTSPSHICC